LKKWKLACPPSELDLVSPNKKGKPLSSLKMYNRKFLPALKKAGLKKIKRKQKQIDGAKLMVYK
jgi:molecular chaperone GrpE (heat shock protein)